MKTNLSPTTEMLPLMSVNYHIMDDESTYSNVSVFAFGNGGSPEYALSNSGTETIY